MLPREDNAAGRIGLLQTIWRKAKPSTKHTDIMLRNWHPTGMAQEAMLPDMNQRQPQHNHTTATKRGPSGRKEPRREVGEETRVFAL